MALFVVPHNLAIFTHSMLKSFGVIADVLRKIVHNFFALYGMHV